MKVRVLIENKVYRPGLVGEHGLSLYGEVEERKFLFDLGQSQDGFLNNCRRLGIDLDSVDFLILSHGHYDHTGALPLLSEVISPKTVVYAHPWIRIGKYRREGNNLKYIGIPKTDWDYLINSCTVDFAFSLRQIDNGLFISGTIPDYGYAKTTSSAYVLENGDEDQFEDEICLYSVVNGEVVVLTGCSHRGILNIVAHAKDVLARPVRAVVGGLHLKGLSRKMLNEVVKGLEALGVKELYPLHCSGLEEVCYVKEKFSGKCEVMGCGDEIVFT